MPGPSGDSSDHWPQLNYHLLQLDSDNPQSTVLALHAILDGVQRDMKKLSAKGFDTLYQKFLEESDSEIETILLRILLEGAHHREKIATLLMVMIAPQTPGHLLETSINYLWIFIVDHPEKMREPLLQQQINACAKCLRDPNDDTFFGIRSLVITCFERHDMTAFSQEEWIPRLEEIQKSHQKKSIKMWAELMIKMIRDHISPEDAENLDTAAFDQSEEEDAQDPKQKNTRILSNDDLLTLSRELAEAKSPQELLDKMHDTGKKIIFLDFHFFVDQITGDRLLQWVHTLERKGVQVELALPLKKDGKEEFDQFLNGSSPELITYSLGLSNDEITDNIRNFFLRLQTSGIRISFFGGQKHPALEGEMELDAQKMNLQNMMAENSNGIILVLGVIMGDKFSYTKKNHLRIVSLPEELEKEFPGKMACVMVKEYPDEKE